MEDHELSTLLRGLRIVHETVDNPAYIALATTTRNMIVHLVTHFVPGGTITFTREQMNAITPDAENARITGQDGTMSVTVPHGTVPATDSSPEQPQDAVPTDEVQSALNTLYIYLKINDVGPDHKITKALQTLHKAAQHSTTPQPAPVLPPMPADIVRAVQRLAKSLTIHCAFIGAEHVCPELEDVMFWLHDVVESQQG